MCRFVFEFDVYVSDPKAVVSPGGVGFDINCGVRLLRTNLMVTQLGDHHAHSHHEK